MIKFIHTGDLHLGLRFHNVSFHKNKAMERRRELWTSFERIVKYAVDKGVDFLFIAGDLFESSYFTIGDIERIRDSFRNAEGVNIIISAGNHDYRGRKSLYDKIEWTENVSIFGGQGIQKRDFPNLNTSIYGYSWTSMEMRENNLFLNMKERIDLSRNNILVLHGDIASRSNYLPLNINELRELNMDYIALGHIHKPEILAENIAYCGCPEPLNFGELGERGIIEGSIADKKLEFELLPFSKRKFLDGRIIIDGQMGYLDIVEKIKNIDMGNKELDFYRINLEGFVQENISLENLEKDLGEDFYHIEIINKTSLDYDLEGLEEYNEGNIVGEFIKKMREKGLDNPVVKEALYLGLEALLGRVNQL